MLLFIVCVFPTILLTLQPLEQTNGSLVVCVTARHDGWRPYVLCITPLPNGSTFPWLAIIPKWCPVGPGDGHTHSSTVHHSPHFYCPPAIRTCTHLWSRAVTMCKESGWGGWEVDIMCWMCSDTPTTGEVMLWLPCKNFLCRCHGTKYWWVEIHFPAPRSWQPISLLILDEKIGVSRKRKKKSKKCNYGHGDYLWLRSPNLSRVKLVQTPPLITQRILTILDADEATLKIYCWWQSS